MLDQVYRPFTGTLKKLMLVSDGVGYGPVPDENDEVQQRLTINSARDAWLTRYAFGDGERYRRIEREKLKLDADHLEDLFRAVTAVFGGDTEDYFATDVGTWELELTNTDDETFQYVGSMCGGILYEGRELSDIIRDALDTPDLLAFGGGKDEDTVIRIELDYQRGTPRTPDCRLRRRGDPLRHRRRRLASEHGKADPRPGRGATGADGLGYLPVSRSRAGAGCRGANE